MAASVIVTANGVGQSVVDEAFLFVFEARRPFLMEEFRIVGAVYKAHNLILVTYQSHSRCQFIRLYVLILDGEWRREIRETRHVAMF